MLYEFWKSEPLPPSLNPHSPFPCLMESVEHSIFTHVKTFKHQTEVSGSKENVCKNCQKKLATAATPDVSGPEKYSSSNLNRYIYQSSNRISVNFQPNYNRQVQNFYLRNYPTLLLSLIQTFQKTFNNLTTVIWENFEINI